MKLERARRIADAVMMEGYALYPYRASAPKNRFRWTFGALAPRAWSEAGGCEPWWLEAQLLVAGAPTRVAGQLRFFQIERRRDGWDEGIERAFEFEITDGACYELAFDGACRDDAERAPIAGRIEIERTALAAEQPLAKIAIRVENTTPWHEPCAARERAIASAFASTHVIVGVDGGELISAIDPPAWTRAAAATCTSTHTYPVLVSPDDDLVLCAPFILYDHPQIAPESAGDLCDACEIDELLMLRTRTLTDAERRAAIATDPRAAAIVARADALPGRELERMHGALRDVRPHDAEMVPRAPAAALAVGSKVRLRAPTRPTDAQDLLYAGHVATVAEIKEDVDGTTFFAVTIDDDPAAQLHDWYGRYHYYRADEVDPL